MTTPAQTNLLAFQNRIATRTLTASDVAFLTGALSAIIPGFVEPGNTAGNDNPLRADWYAQLYAIAAGVQASGSGGSMSGPAPGTPGFNPTWYALTDIYWDPANSSGLASDSNSGASSGAPLLTFGEIVNRYGSNAPEFNFGQSVTCHMLSSQPAGQDPVFFQPLVSGGGQAVLNCQAALVAAGAAFAAGALSGGFGFAGAAPSAGGTPLEIAATPGYVVAGVLLQNTTRGSWSWVDAISGGAAVCTQPQTNASLVAPLTAGVPAGVADNDWVAGDNIAAWIAPNLNLLRWEPIGGNASAGGQLSGGWVLFAAIADNANGLYEHASRSNINVLSCCSTAARLYTGGEGARGLSLLNVLCKGNYQSNAAAAVLFSGGAVQGSSSVLEGGFFSATNNAILHGSWSLNAGAVLNATGVFGDGTLTVNTGGVIRPGAGGLWGSYACTVNPGGTFYNATGSTFALSALLTTGTLKLVGATTGSSYAAGVWTDGVNITPANLDADNGLQSPRSGARFTNGI